MGYDLLELVLAYSKRIKDNRSRYYVLAKATEELGECATEVCVAEGEGYKTAGKDGVVGEAMDSILALIDLIYIDNPEVETEDLIKIAIKKLDKWESKVTAEQNK